jgi:two-component system chemotaxis sensor kinase CheA
MQMEESPEDKELINSVFRIMHSLKGSGAMFGYTNLSGFTHKLESLYDDIRNSKIELSPEIISFTIDITDHIKKLLEDKDNPELVEKSKEYEDEIERRFLLPKEEIIEKPHEEQINTGKEPLSKAKASNNKLFYIEFAPNEDILNDGTKPLYLLDELSDLGDCIFSTNCSALPMLSELDYEKCYLSWKIIISTSENEDMIKDVFIFVEDDSKLVIKLLSEEDVFQVEGVKVKLQNILDEGLQGFKGLKRLTNIYKKELPSTAQKIVTIDKTDEEEDAIEENLIAKTKDSQPKKDQQIARNTFAIDSIRISSSKLDELINLVSEFVTNQARLYNLSGKINTPEINELSEDFNNLARQFRDIAFDMRLIPIQTIVIKFKRLVRDLSKKLNKKVAFVAHGTETELDKNIIATISDPIMHIIRNSLDHGIESPDKRLKANKEETGTIEVKAKNSGAFVLISISDDGAGIDIKAIEKKAIEKKLIPEKHELDENTLLNLIMQPGFTTNDTVTDISGRGVGMDVVKKNIESLRGELEISSEKGKGTTITIKLPLTLSIIDGLLTGINGGYYIFPLSSIVKIHSIARSDFENSYKNLITIDGRQYAFVNLCGIFKNKDAAETVFNLLLVSYKNTKVGIIVNEIISEYQAVLKPVDNISQTNEIFSGASILGNGSLAMVIDPHKLINNFGN